MRLERWIGQIKAECPIFCGRVLGAAELQAISKANIPLTPSAYVVPLTDKTTSKVVGTLYSEVSDYAVGVVSVVKNVADQRGEASFIDLRPARLELKQALCGWMDDDMPFPVVSSQGRLLGYNNAIMQYVDVFVGKATFKKTMAIRI